MTEDCIDYESEKVGENQQIERYTWEGIRGRFTYLWHNIQYWDLCKKNVPNFLIVEAGAGTS